MAYKLIFYLLFFISNISATTIIDVRTSSEWNSGHLDGAINIEWQNILSLSKDISKDEKIYLYCRSGNRSGKATKILLDNGYQNVINAGSLEQASKLLNKNIINQ
jgi:phage shock protein E